MPAIIEPPALPIYLYRYRSLYPRARETARAVFARELQAIKQPYIWCSNFKALNDPMEGFYRPSNIVQKKSNYRQIVSAIYAGKSGLGIAILSDTKENELMWTHYAGNYAGICIEYYADRLRNGLPNNMSLVRLGYDERPPRLTKPDLQNGHAAHKILSQKKFSWAYEREWRLLGRIGKAEIADHGCVRSVYLGSRIDAAQKNKVLAEMKKRKIDVYAMNVDGYHHVWQPLYRAPRNVKDEADEN